MKLLNVFCLLVSLATATELRGGEERELSSTIRSCKYKYQKCTGGKIYGICLYWSSTQYRWCAQKATKQRNFPSSFGELEFWDDDRLKKDGECQNNVRCTDRSDIGDCSHDSTVGGFRLYKC